MANRLTLVDAIDVLLEDTNGVHVFSNERTSYGYIAANLFMYLPAGIIYDAPMDANLVDYGSSAGVSAHLGPAGNAFRAANPYLGPNALTPTEVLKVTLVNFIKLRNAGLNDEVAWSVSNLRARWLTLGCYYTNIRDRGTLYSESTIVRDNDPDVGQIVAAADINAITQTAQYVAIRDIADRVMQHDFYGTVFAVTYAETIWCTSELVFRIRGHHYKPEYEDLIARTIRASTQGAVELPDNYDFANIFHTAIHPFGVRALPVMAYKFIVLGKVGDSLITRFSGAPTGTAIFTTTSAGINMLKGEAFYDRFQATFPQPIRACHEFARQIMNNKYSYHISASLYGLPRITTFQLDGKSYTIAEAEQMVVPLAPMLKGYTTTIQQIMQQNVGMTFAYGNQKVLDKRASNNPLGQIRMSKLLEKIVTTLEEAKSVDTVMDTFLNKVSTQLAITAPQSNAAPALPSTTN